MFSFHSKLVLPNDHFISAFHSEVSYSFLISLMLQTCHALFIFFDLITQILSGEDYKLWMPSLCSFLHTYITFTLLAPIIPLATDVVKNPKLYYCRVVRDWISLKTELQL